MSTDIKLITFNGPLHDDDNTTRHVALFCVFPDESNVMMEIFGGTGAWSFRPREDFDPYGCKKYRGAIPVAVIPGKENVQLIQEAIKNTAIQNGHTDFEYNCQSWVCEALSQLVRYNFLTKDQRENIVGAMLDNLLD